MLVGDLEFTPVEKARAEARGQKYIFPLFHARFNAPYEILTGFTEVEKFRRGHYS